MKELPASWRTISSRSSLEMTPSPSTSNTLKMRRSLSVRVARLLQHTKASTNSCTARRTLGACYWLTCADTAQGLLPALRAPPFGGLRLF